MLSIKNLKAGYGKVEVLHGISIDVPKSQVITLIGSNGAGKTTTMRAITGMIKPTEGQITLGDQDITGYDSYKVAKLGVAHSPEGRRVFSTMTVTDNLTLGAFPRLTGSRPKGDVKHDLEKAMDLFPRLKERRTQLAGTLSGGEQQRLAIARAIVNRPAILIADEPTASLDIDTARRIMSVFKDFNRVGVTTVIASHDDALMAEYATRAFKIEPGKFADSAGQHANAYGHARAQIKDPQSHANSGRSEPLR